MPNSDSRLDERIRKELKELEAPYNESHWNEIEPFVSNLAPRSNFKIGSRTILGISLLIVLIVATYFALPFMNRETKETVPATETPSEDTASTDPGFRPDTIKPAPVSTPAVTTTVDTTKLVQDTVAAKVEAPVQKEIKTETPVEPKPKKKKKKEVKKEDTPPTPEPEEGDNDLLKKDVPIIAVPQDEPAKEEPKKEEPVTP